MPLNAFFYYLIFTNFNAFSMLKFQRQFDTKIACRVFMYSSGTINKGICGKIFTLCVLQSSYLVKTTWYFCWVKCKFIMLVIKYWNSLLTGFQHQRKIKLTFEFASTKVIRCQQKGKSIHNILELLLMRMYVCHMVKIHVYLNFPLVLKTCSDTFLKVVSIYF